ncbi:MAG: DegV family protein [Clostridia bacterium]|nr:DegV family protein [Clostridia bacterium]
MKIAISVETTADLTLELLKENDIKLIPFPIALGEDNYLDGEITADDIIAYVDKTKKLPKTSAINQYSYSEHFENILKEYDGIVHFSISSKLSCACENAMRAAENLKNVFVIDTLSLSTGIGLLALYGAQLVKQGKSAKEIYDLCKKRVPYIQASFELNRVDYLYKGGRCSVLSLLGANILKIRPQIIVQDGKMIAGKKYRGNFKHVVENYCSDVLEQFNTPDLENAFVTYTTAPAEIVAIAVNYLKDAGFKNIHVTRASGTITSHCGENCLGILYLNDGNSQ